MNFASASGVVNLRWPIGLAAIISWRGLLIALRLAVYLGQPRDLAGLKRGGAVNIGPYAPEEQSRDGFIRCQGVLQLAGFLVLK